VWRCWFQCAKHRCTSSKHPTEHGSIRT
jgi:hypothetical protein